VDLNLEEVQRDGGKAPQTLNHGIGRFYLNYLNILATGANSKVSPFKD
jgi:hypothetical protein